MLMLLPSILAGFSTTAMSLRCSAKIIQNMFTLLNVGHLTSTETKRHLHFVSFLDKLLCVVYFSCSSHSYQYLEIIELPLHLQSSAFLCLFFFPCLLIFVFTVIDNLAYRRLCCRSNLHEIKLGFQRNLLRFSCRHNS